MAQWINNRPIYPNELYHYGVMGMKWGIRNYQPYPSDYKGTGVYKGKKGVEYGSKRDVKKYTKFLQRVQKAKNSKEYNRKNYLRTNSTGARHSQKNGFKNGELVNEKQARAAYKKQLLANGFSENKAKWLSERVYENSLQNLAGSSKQLKYHISEMKKLYGT